MVDAGIGHHKAETVLDDQQSRTMPHDAFRFRQHHLDEARVLVDLGGECDRSVRGLDCRHVDITPLSLGDDLLRHNQHIAGFRDDPVCRKRGNDDRTEIVSRLDQLYAGKRGQS